MGCGDVNGLTCDAEPPPDVVGEVCLFLGWYSDVFGLPCDADGLTCESEPPLLSGGGTNVACDDDGLGGTNFTDGFGDSVVFGLPCDADGLTCESEPPLLSGGGTNVACDDDGLGGTNFTDGFGDSVVFGLPCDADGLTCESEPPPDLVLASAFFFRRRVTNANIPLRYAPRSIRSVCSHS
jgi:hypothetical protein